MHKIKRSHPKMTTPQNPGNFPR